MSITKSKARASMTIAGAAVVACLAGWAVCGVSNADADAVAAGTGAAEGSLVAVHEELGMDISSIEEVSWSTCEPCHGDYQAIREATDAMWPAIGQITEANPHKSHASNALECEDCHTLSDGPQVNQCAVCHNFEAPEGWVDREPTTTIFQLSGGPVTLEEALASAH